MDKLIITLNTLPIGKAAIIKKLMLDSNSRRRMLDLGLIENTIIKSLHESPSKDPIAYGIRGTVIALRKEQTSKIMVESLE